MTPEPSAPRGNGHGVKDLSIRIIRAEPETARHRDDLGLAVLALNMGDHLDVEVEVQASFAAEGQLTIEPPHIMSVAAGNPSFRAGPLFGPERFSWRLRATSSGKGSVTIRLGTQTASLPVDVA